MSKLHLTVGLPASGKTTAVNKMMEAEKNWVRVNRDDIRRELFPDPTEPIGYKFNGKNEGKVTEVAHGRIREAFGLGFNVVCDDTNLTDRAVNSLSAIAKEFNAEIVIDDSFLDVPLEELLERNYRREHRVPDSVIHRMWAQAIVPRLKVDNAPTYPWAIIIDVDGTLTMGPHNRSPYDFSKVGNDLPNTFVASIVENFPSDIKRIILTGREDSCSKETEEWLEFHGIEYDEIYMRSEGDSRADTVIKRELFDQFIFHKYYVFGVLDDRQSMVRMWRDMGFNVIRVGDPDASF